MKRSPLRRRESPLSGPLPRDVAAAVSRGPADEKRDATRVLMPTAAELMRTTQFQQLYEMAKADGNVAKPVPGTAMALIDIGDVGGQRVQYARPVGMSFDQLRMMVREGLILKLIINTRIRQVQAFLNQPDGAADPGFKLRFKRRGRQVTEADDDRLDWLTNYLMNCGAEFDPRRRRAMGRDDLDDFTAKHLRDSLTMDHAPLELVPTAGGRVHGWVSVDAGHVYLTDPNAGLLDDYDGPAEFNQLMSRAEIRSPQDIIAVYEKDGVARATYTHEDMMIPIRNVTSDERYYGYGMPEPEEIARVTTNLLNAMNLNARSITDNAIPRGILGIMGDYEQEDIDQLTYRLEAEMRGASNRFRTPMMRLAEGGGITFTPTGNPVEDQLYARWITLNVAISSSAYSMNPEEIAFESYTAGSSTLSGSDTEAKLTSGTDKGLTTLLKWYRKTLNELISLQDPDVELIWNGLHVSKEEAAAREDSILTFGEKRAQYGVSTENIDERLLNTPMNPALQGVYLQVIQPAPQPGAAGAPGQDQGQPGQEQEQPQGQPEAEDQQQQEAPPEQATGAEGQTRYRDGDGGVWQQGGMKKAESGYVADLLNWPQDY